MIQIYDIESDKWGRIVNKYQCFNIHIRDLTNNRGPYLLIQTILNDSKYTISTLYKLGEKIDTGLIISKYKMKVNKNDNSISLAQKLDDGIKQHLNYLVNHYLNEPREYMYTDIKLMKVI